LDLEFVPLDDERPPTHRAHLPPPGPHGRVPWRQRTARAARDGCRRISSARMISQPAFSGVTFRPGGLAQAPPRGKTAATTPLPTYAPEAPAGSHPAVVLRGPIRSVNPSSRRGVDVTSSPGRRPSPTAQAEPARNGRHTPARRIA
jgi:hypothetical protein